MKEINIIFLLTFVVVLFSCSSKKSVFYETKLVTVPIEIRQENQWIKNNLELDRIVPIETTKEHLLGNIKRVILYKDKLIILDRQQPTIFVVNAYTGKIETNIHYKGNGPGESRSIMDIAFDDKNEHILAFNDWKRLISFSLDGKFLKDERIDKLYENITYDNGNVVFYNDGEGYSCFPYSVDIYNLANQKLKTLGKNQKVEFHVRGKGRLLVKSKNIWFVPILDYSLHLLDGDTIKVPYILDVKNALTDKELIKKSVSNFPSFAQVVRERNMIYGIQSVRETEKYLVFTTNLPGFMMMNKNTLELQATPYIDDKYLGIKLLNYFPHDGDDNKIMFIVQPDELMQRKLYEQNDMPERMKAEIEKSILNRKIDDNPILVFYKEK